MTGTPDHDHEHHGHDHDHDHDHEHHHDQGHANDQGLAGMLRYLRHAPQMWRSEINDAVVAWVAPSKGELVVDVGAGMGAGAVRAIRSGAAVVAVEPTPYMRRLLRLRRLGQRARTLLTVVDGSAERLPVDDASIDALWAVNSMHHWIDPDRAVVEFSRALRPGGRVVLVDEDFQDPTHPDFERFGTKHAGSEATDGPAEHHGFTMVDATEMGERLRRSGFFDVEAGTRQLTGRPVIAITANRAPSSS